MTRTCIVGASGFIATNGAVIVSKMEVLRNTLQITSLAVGIFVGVLTAVSLAITIRNKLNNKNKQNDPSIG